MSNDEICWAKSQLNVLKFRFFQLLLLLSSEQNRAFTILITKEKKKNEPNKQSKNGKWANN